MEASAAGVPAPVPAGNFLMHHPHIVHGSLANTTTRPRIACGLVYVATDARPIVRHAPESTVMIRGVDRHGHVLHDPAPTGDFERDRATWQAAYDRQHDNYYRMPPVPATAA
jgi:hypothetical protein